eukprot:Gregarina_sp_Poly_1__7005@NODE_3813_length_873_cov_4_949132_g2455_i0_p1_GENE_NODE_3813_length_873_cov_4_949132_g2455_i0NODE_3813_length_873_cov_4_949132_g2455_i0_p1_ORF_typecomplete_len221_score40_37_NODE_3813_length_873_cov_4_949132_g2455_i0206868
MITGHRGSGSKDLFVELFERRQLALDQKRHQLQDSSFASPVSPPSPGGTVSLTLQAVHKQSPRHVSSSLRRISDRKEKDRKGKSLLDWWGVAPRRGDGREDREMTRRRLVSQRLEQQLFPLVSSGLDDSLFIIPRSHSNPNTTSPPIVEPELRRALSCDFVKLQGPLRDATLLNRFTAERTHKRKSQLGVTGKALRKLIIKGFAATPSSSGKKRRQKISL